MGAEAETPSVEQAVEAFVAELTYWREVRGFSKKGLASEMGFHASYVSHVESGRHRPTEDFVRRAEAVLGAGGALWRQWQDYEAVRRHHAPHALAHVSRPVEAALAPGAGLIVEHDDARLRYADGAYHALMRRRLYNAGTEPITRYLIRISVDRYPGQPERSNRLYREHPLTWEGLDLTARCDGEEMAWRAKHDRDAFKEVWLLFENARGRFPLYPGQRAWIEYAYTVDEGRWGPWFQRAVRLPTRHLSVRLVFPADAEPTAWGTETSMTAASAPFRTAIRRREEDDQVIFDWTTEDPPLHARYRMEWRFGHTDSRAARVEPEAPRASERMRAVGIVQEGDPILIRTAVPFDLPREAEAARGVIEELDAAMRRVAEVHVFGKGMGLAAPQIGVDRAAAIVRPTGHRTEPIVLLNPRVIAASAESDEQYEGCLSFFDVRGMVPRPLRLEVEHTTFDGQRLITTFDRAVARLVAHEVDHLHGRLYTDRMRPGVRPISVEEYRDIGRAWKY